MHVDGGEKTVVAVRADEPEGTEVVRTPWSLTDRDARCRGVPHVYDEIWRGRVAVGHGSACEGRVGAQDKLRSGGAHENPPSGDLVAAVEPAACLNGVFEEGTNSGEVLPSGRCGHGVGSGR